MRSMDWKAIMNFPDSRRCNGKIRGDAMELNSQIRGDAMELNPFSFVAPASRMRD
jgi:hypothetical protein